MGGPARIDGQFHPETDNFQAVKFTINGIEYYSAENYFQFVSPFKLPNKSTQKLK